MKTAIAHADRLVREALRRSLAQGGTAPAWMAADAGETERRQAREPVDLLLLDAGMAGRGGDLVARMGAAGAACLMLGRDDDAGIYDALSAGALGHVLPPRIEADGELLGAQRLLDRIVRLRALVEAPRGRSDGDRPGAPGRADSTLVALGASTGGPAALARVLGALPAGLAATVLVVQHIDDDFSAGLAEWLGSHCLLPVRLARAGDYAESGQVYVAAPGGHLALLPSRQFARLSARPGELHVPGIDVLFQQLAGWRSRGVAALLTGMGDDGARGLLALRQAGWHTIAQDETSSAVYGMPRAAHEIGAALQVLPLTSIGSTIAARVTRAVSR
jgi:two-component system, chemotaxis family, response regulator WspF